VINARLIAQISKVMGQFYPDTCTLQGEMGSPPTFTTVDNVPCRVQPVSPNTPTETTEIIESAPMYELRVHPTQPLVIGWQCVHAGHTYDIKVIQDDRVPALFTCAYMVRVTA